MNTNTLHIQDGGVARIILSIKSNDSYGAIIKFLFGLASDFIAKTGVALITIQYVYDPENNISSLVVIYSNGSSIDLELKRLIGNKVNNWISNHQDHIMKEEING